MNASDDERPDELSLLPREDVDRLDPSAPLAVFFVGGDYPLQAHSLPLFKDTQASGFGQLLFVSVGVADAGWTDVGVLGAKNFKGTEEARRLLQITRRQLDECLLWAHHAGFKADCSVSIGVNVAEECDRLAAEIATRYPKSSFFVTKLVPRRRGLLDRLLHEHTADRIRGLLEKRGLPVTVLPVVLPE